MTHVKDDARRQTSRVSIFPTPHTTYELSVSSSRIFQIRAGSSEMCELTYDENQFIPRAWGPHGRIPVLQPQWRFIPTCVGSTMTPAQLAFAPPVHPHVRGVHPYLVLVTGVVRGSSPRAWGPRQFQRVAESDMRFIPTCVGSTMFAFPSFVGRAVHPHVRGVHPLTPSRPLYKAGSSPRAWGPRYRYTDFMVSIRFIPTCVGSTIQIHGFHGLYPVHPHVRGVHRGKGYNLVHDDGSSPRAWGPPGARHAHLRSHRFIPTCVGSTQRFPLALTGFPVHPHVRGVHVRPVSLFRLSLGSSPRAWGPLYW